MSTIHRATTKKKPRARAEGTPSRKPIRTDRAGHYDPRYAADLRAKSGRPASEPDAFVRLPRSHDALAEELGEEATRSMTTGETQDPMDTIVDEELGGPFVTSSVAEEVARGPDASNPRGATREPFPKT